MRQSVLAEDLRCWNRHQRDEVEEAAGRRRRRRGGEEGLDEGGEAPPAYVRVPDRALLMGEGKPPDYEERVGGGG